MAKTLSIAPPNSLIFIADASGGTVPEFIANSPILSTESMISVSCLANVDGDTTITLGAVAEMSVAEAPVFDDMLLTPSGKLVVSTVEDESILSAIVPMHTTRIRVWTNRAAEPAKIVIGWGE
jgi:hypothetical protein